MKQQRLRRVPGDLACSLDQPIGIVYDEINSKYTVKLLVNGTADWIHMIGPIGIYYIHKLDLHIV